MNYLSQPFSLSINLQASSTVTCADCFCRLAASTHLKSARTSARHASTAPPHVNHAVQHSSRQLCGHCWTNCLSLMPWFLDLGICNRHEFEWVKTAKELWCRSDVAWLASTIPLLTSSPPGQMGRCVRESITCFYCTTCEINSWELVQASSKEANLLGLWWWSSPKGLWEAKRLEENRIGSI